MFLFWWIITGAASLAFMLLAICYHEHEDVTWGEVPHANSGIPNHWAGYTDIHRSLCVIRW
jgi:hypothetical protein